MYFMIALGRYKSHTLQKPWYNYYMYTKRCNVTNSVPCWLRNVKSESKNSFLTCSSEKWYWPMIDCM